MFYRVAIQAVVETPEVETFSAIVESAVSEFKSTLSDALGIDMSTIFPEKLMETWTTAVPATGIYQHAKLCIFISGLSILAGSLGGGADSQNLVRGVLFTDEES